MLKKQRQFHYEVFTLEMDESRQGEHFIPFTIKLPLDVKDVVGVMMRTNAIANIGRVYFSPDPKELGTPSDLNLISASQAFELSGSIAEAYDRYKKTGVLNGQIKLTQETSGGTFYFTLKLDEYVLGSVSLQSYEKSGQFYAQDLSPNRLTICAKQDTPPPNYQEHDFLIKDYSGKPDDYVPVKVRGDSREVFGFFRTTAFGKKLADPAALSNGEKASDNFPRAPFKIKIYLKCTLKRKS